MKFIIKDGNLNNALTYIKDIDKSKQWVVTVNRYVNSRTIRQNNALFGYAYPILEAHTGFTKKEIHEHFCMKFFGEIKSVVMGRVMYHPSRTTTENEYGHKDILSSEQFGRFFNMVQMDAAGIGCDIPDPQQQPDW